MFSVMNVIARKANLNESRSCVPRKAWLQIHSQYFIQIHGRKCKCFVSRFLSFQKLSEKQTNFYQTFAIFSANNESFNVVEAFRITGNIHVKVTCSYTQELSLPAAIIFGYAMHYWRNNVHYDVRTCSMSNAIPYPFLYWVALGTWLRLHQQSSWLLKTNI